MEITIFITLMVFLSLVLSLVGILLFAKSQLVSSGKINIQINGEKTIEVSAGSSLLSTLSNEGIFLPSACGGGGTCLQCKCQVLSGGGEILPTEKPYFSRKQIAEKWRLGCQVKVKESMNVRVPEEVFGIKKLECEVTSNYNVASFIKEFVVQLPPNESMHFEAGGYIQIDIPSSGINYHHIDITSHPDLQKYMNKKPDEFKAEWDKFKLWDLNMKNDEIVTRAYSMASHPAEGNRVMLNVRIATPPFDRVKGG